MSAGRHSGAAGAESHHDRRARQRRDPDPVGDGRALLKRRISWPAIRRMLRSLRGGAVDVDATVVPARPYVARIRQPVRADRPRVLHVIANVWTGGSTRLVVDLFEHLGHAYEQRVLTRDAPPTPAYTGLEMAARPRLGSRRSTIRLIRELGPDLIHVHWLGHRRTAYSRIDWDWYARLFEAIESRGLPAIENVNIPVEPYRTPAVVRYVYVSTYVRDRFGRAGDPNVVIHPGSDLTLFRPRPQPGGEFIGMVYRLERDKLDESAIEVFVEVLQARPEARALIVGGGTLLPTFQSRVREADLEDRVEFTGYRPYEALPDLFARMHVAVAPVHSESFGQVTPFAMGMELPVAAYAVGALPELLGEDAPLAPPGATRALAATIGALLDDPERRRRIGRANRDRAERLFSLETMLRKYDQLWSEVLAGGERSPAEAKP